MNTNLYNWQLVDGPDGWGPLMVIEPVWPLWVNPTGLGQIGSTEVPQAQWIGPQGAAPPQGTYKYTARVSHEDLQLHGRIAADNRANLELNGALLAVTEKFNEFTEFEVGTSAIQPMNTLTCFVENLLPGPTGLLIEFADEPLPTPPPPPPPGLRGWILVAEQWVQTTWIESVIAMASGGTGIFLNSSEIIETTITVDEVMEKIRNAQ